MDWTCHGAGYIDFSVSVMLGGEHAWLKLHLSQLRIDGTATVALVGDEYAVAYLTTIGLELVPFPIPSEQQMEELLRQEQAALQARPEPAPLTGTLVPHGTISGVDLGQGPVTVQVQELIPARLPMMQLTLYSAAYIIQIGLVLSFLLALTGMVPLALAGLIVGTALTLFCLFGMADLYAYGTVVTIAGLVPILMSGRCW